MANQVLLLVCAITIVYSHYAASQITCPHRDFEGKHLAPKGTYPTEREAAQAFAPLAYNYRIAMNVRLVASGHAEEPLPPVNTVFVLDPGMDYDLPTNIRGDRQCIFRHAVSKFNCWFDNVNGWTCTRVKGKCTATHLLKNGHYILGNDRCTPTARPR